MAQREVAVALYGNPIVQAYHLSNVIEKGNTETGKIISMIRGATHKVNLESNRKEIGFKLLFNLDKYGNQSYLAEYINNIIEDYISRYMEGINDKLKIKCSDLFKHILEDDGINTNVYASKYVQTFRNVVITKKDIEPFLEGNRINFKLVHLNQHLDNKFVKFYNALFLSIKHFIIKSIQTEITFGYEIECNSRNNCIQIEGKLPNNSINDLYKQVLCLTIDNDLIARLLTLIEVSTPTEANDISYILCNNTKNSPEYIEVMDSADYILYCETKDRFNNSAKQVMEEINVLSKLSPNTRTSYILMDENNLPTEIKDLSEIASDSLSERKDIPTLKTLLGDVELGWYDDERYEYGVGEDIENINIDCTDKAEDIVENVFFERRDVGINLSESTNYIDFSLLNKEFKRVGMDGFTGTKVRGFGEVYDRIEMSELKTVGNPSNYFDNFQFSEVETGGGKVEIYMISDFELNSDLNNTIREKVSNEYEEINAIDSNEVDERFILTNSSSIVKVLRNTRNLFMESISIAKNSEIIDILLELVLSDLTEKTLTHLLSSFTNEKYDYNINDSVNEKVIKSNLNMKILMSTYTDILVEARNYWKNKSTNKDIIRCDIDTATDFINHIFSV